jgi:sugar phosphate isomerase/epimerase
LKYLHGVGFLYNVTSSWAAGARRNRRKGKIEVAHELSLHHVTAMDVSPAELISIAARLGLHYVCLFTNITPATAELFPCVWSAAVRRDVAQRCASEGITVHNLEWFDVSPSMNLDTHRRGLEIGAALGAKLATTHVYDDDMIRGSDGFARFCEVAAEFGISPCIEFTPLTPTKTIGTAIEILRRADKQNGGIALDTLHLVRSGGTVEDVASLEQRYLRSVQISDGPLPGNLDAYFDEAVFERQIPGEGAFPLAALFKVLPEDLVVDVEVPLRSLKQGGVSPFERCRLAVAGARRIVNAAT